MDKLLEKYGWKKVGIFLICICVVIIGFSLLSLYNIDKESLSNAKKALTDRVSGSGTIREKAFQSIYTNKYFSISLPQDYKVHEYQAPPNLLSSIRIVGQDNYGMSIEVYPLSSFSVKDLTGPFESFKFTRSELLIPAGPAILYEGSFPSEPILFEKVAFVNIKGVIIRMLYSSLGESSTTQIQMFDRILESLR